MRTGILVGDAMTRKPVHVSPETTLEECSRIMDREKVGSVIVHGKGKILGIISDQDIVRKAVSKGANVKKAQVLSYMEEDVITITPEKDIFDAMSVMRDLGIKHLPVVSKASMVGLITQKDILKIQPSLFEILVDKIKLREMEEKPIFMIGAEGICGACGFYSKQMTDIKGNLYCPKCKDEIDI